MSETRRLLQAAAALSQVLRAKGIPHAFYGSIISAVLAGSSHSDEIYCIVQGGQSQAHPFRRVRDAIAGNDDFAATHSPWTNRLLVSYRRLIPAIEIEILPAGETGPRVLGEGSVMVLHDVPFLALSEFVRAKLKSWTIRGLERDAQDIIFVLSRFWNRVDMNRIPEADMEQFAARHADVAPAWTALKRKYGM
ncbi:hypothetical protein HGRIS_000207 [Hohenbuehelia grisea]|uniref:Nucleotidyltransferase family protein n=1 Tax=Hohenbuehelia grisea TaxID=104357 RepID=A0ABR3JSF7_9AGAR